jgi:phosphopantothenoylcysteine decarboxylase/phosphopantothenate--cysteine ligase
MPHLQTKRILLGVTGGVAAYKAAELTRLLVKTGADVRVVMTEAATHFVTPLTFQALSGKPVLTQLWDVVPTTAWRTLISRVMWTRC